MAARDSKAIVRQLIETQNGHADESLTALSGGAPLHASSTVVFESCSDVRFRVEDQVAEADLVASRLVMTGTVTRALPGLASAGEPVRTTAMSMHRVLAGRVVEAWLAVDLIPLLVTPTQTQP